MIRKVLILGFLAGLVIVAAVAAVTVSAQAQSDSDDGPRWSGPQGRSGPLPALLSEFIDQEALEAEIAQALGMTPDEFDEARSDGMTLFELSEQDDVDLTALREIQTSYLEQALEEALESGAIAEWLQEIPGHGVGRFGFGDGEGILAEYLDSEALHAALAEALANRLRQDLIVAALAATVGSLVIGLLIARRLTRPIQEVRQASQAVARGNMKTRVPVRSEDELGELASAFNRMQSELESLQRQRRDMIADIAHELRTPLGVLLGNAEALRDGVLAPIPERLDAVHDQARRLSRLVEDFRTLSLGEAGELPTHLQEVDLRGLITSAVARHQPRALEEQLEMVQSITATETVTTVDPDRISQVRHLAIERDPARGPARPS